MATRGKGRQQLGYAWKTRQAWRSSISTLTRRTPSIAPRNTAIWNDWFDINVATLTVADAAQAQASDSPTLTQHFVIQVASVETVQTAEEVTLTAHEPERQTLGGVPRVYRPLAQRPRDEDEIIVMLFVAQIIAWRRYVK